jgi:hypothetical protein
MYYSGALCGIDYVFHPDLLHFEHHYRWKKGALHDETPVVHGPGVFFFLVDTFLLGFFLTC